MVDRSFCICDDFYWYDINKLNKNGQKIINISPFKGVLEKFFLFFRHIFFYNSPF